MSPRPLRIVGTCGEAWDAMLPRGAGRHCVSCDRVVLDLAGMTLAEARAHVERARRETGSACGRAERDPVTGELVFAPSPREPRAPSHAARGALLAAALVTSVPGCDVGARGHALPSAAAQLVPLAPAPCAASSPRPDADGGLPPPPPLPRLTGAAGAADTPNERAAQRAAQRRKHPVPTYAGPVYEVGFMD